MKLNWLTDRGKSTVTLSHCGAASDESNKEKQGTDCYNGYSRDQSVNVLEEVIVVIVSDKNIGSNITKDAGGGLWGTRKC